ncbi:MAG: M3 family metallopeptidase [Saprospiraceae bacterium]
MTLKMKMTYFNILCCFLISLKAFSQAKEKMMQDPFMVDLNVPIEYSKLTPSDLENYSKRTLSEVTSMLSTIRKQQASTFENVFVAMDDIKNKINTTSNNCFMMYWVSTDSLIRAKGLAGYQLLDSLSTSIQSDKGIFNKMLSFKSTSAYNKLKGNKKTLVDDMILNFKQSGVNLNAKQISKFKSLTKEINQLSTDYSSNMNSSSEILSVDENGMMGLSDDFKSKYKVGEGKYEIPIINATSETVMSNASNEETRKAYYMKFATRASDKNLSILDSMVRKRDALGKVMSYNSYASYSLVQKMAKDPKTVWGFINDLVGRSKEKAKLDIEILEKEKKEEMSNQPNVKLQPWDISFYKNQIVKKQYQVNNEELRAYFPMDQCLKGMFEIYQKLLGFEFRKVNNPSVWHEEVEMYEVYEGKKLKGRFYMDLFPRPNKETWFYGVNIVSGKATKDGYEIPVSMLLGNFTKPSANLPSLLSQKELNTLFHEFGHIVNMMSYHGDYTSQSNSKDDFTEAMSQLFENWLWNYDILSSFAKNYKTGEILPRTTFDNMVNAKNVASGLSAIQSLQKCLYDLNLYDKYNSSMPIPTDQIWKDIDQQLGLMNFYVENTHPQASWIHINTHPVYYYGYLWSRVYAQDMFTVFEKNGLTNVKTGKRYRELILANGTQRDVIKAVEEFLGRPSDNKAYIKSLGLE